MKTTEINDKLINISNNIVEKLRIGFVFDNKDYCKLYTMNILQHVVKMLDKLDLIDESKKQINSMFNKLINE